MPVTEIPAPEDQPLIVARDTFRQIGLSETTGYELIRQGKFPIPLVRIGGRWFAKTRDLRRFLGLDA
jgi:predicted DNA-binding transcriptional regulator AlpA